MFWDDDEINVKNGMGQGSSVHWRYFNVFCPKPRVTYGRWYFLDSITQNN